MKNLIHKSCKLITAVAFAVLLQTILFTATAEATVCTNQCQGGYVNETYVVESIYWPGGYYGGGWCGYGAGDYPAGTYNCYGTRQVWSNCATTQQVCTHPSPTIIQSSPSSAPLEVFTVDWDSSNASSCTVNFTSPSGPAGSISGLSGSQSFSPNNPGSYGATNTCTDAGGESASASITHTVTAPPLTASITQDTTSTVQGTSFYITWSSNGASSCTVTYSGPLSGTLSSGPTSGGPTEINPGTAGTYSATNTCTNGSTNASQSISHTVTAKPAPGLTLSQSKNPTASKEPFTASWNATGAASCDITFSGPIPTETLAGQPTSGTLNFSPQNLGTYTMSTTCTNSSGTATTSSLTHTVNGSDLTAGAITPVSAVAGVAKTFSATVSNNSSYSTIEGFTSLFQQGTTATGGTVADVAAVSTASALDANGTVIISTSYTFTNSGIYYVRLCADKDSSAGAGTITESLENNNCGEWTVISVTKPGDKTITRGESVSMTSNMGGVPSCTTAATTYPALSDGIRTAWNGTTKTNGQVTSFSPVLAPSGSYVFSCTNGSLTDSATLNVLDCPAGNPWNGSSCGAPGSCAVATQTWSGGCSGPAPSTSNGGSVTVTNTAGGYSGSATYTCNSGSWSGPSGASCSGIPVIRNETVNYPNISFICDYSTSYTVVRNEGSFSTSGSTTSGATVTVPITMEGNYTLTCISGGLSDSAVVNYTVPVTTFAGMSITASPRTTNNNMSTAISWSVDNPKSTCSLRAEAVCTGGRALCTAAQLSAETAINSTLTNGTTDANDPYGPGRNIQTAVKTVAPANNPTGSKALGKKTILMNYTTDFILDCGGALMKKVRVNVSAENEG